MKPTPIILATAALAIGAWSLLNPTTQAAKLLPFQGRLTDASGNAIADGAKVVQFKIYDAPTGGTAVWNGEVQKVTVNGGLVSTLLGSKADLTAVDFNQALYLEITVDANADNQITAADPPLLPRQSVLPAVFAVEASQISIVNGTGQRVGSANWGALVSNASDPNTANWRIDGSKIASGTISTSQLASGSITAAQLYSETAQALVPAGTILPFGGVSAPPGYLMCDGAAVSRATYAPLFAVISVAYGAPNGSTFNLPDFRGRFLRGADDPDGAAPTFTSANVDPDKDSRTPIKPGGSPGNNVGSSQSSQFAAHSHESNVGFGVELVGPGRAINAAAYLPGIGTISYNAPVAGARADTTTSVGGSETRPTNVAVNYIIKY